VIDFLWIFARRFVFFSRAPILSRGDIPTLLFCTLLAAPALADEKPVLSPDQPTPLVTQSHVSATIEFALPALAAAITRDVPVRLAMFDERIACVHRRVFIFRVNANCDIWGYLERTGPVSLYGSGDRVIGAAPIYGTGAGQGANRFTARIHGEAEARATVEAEARPELRRDWSLDLNISDGFHWDEPPILHVLGRDIPLARYVEPRIQAQLVRVRAQALAAARALDLRGKAEAAWKRAFDPIKLSDDPEVWLQTTPQSAAFAGVRADSKVLRGTLEIDGTAATTVGEAPTPVAPTPLAPLGGEVSAPGTFDVILPVKIGYDTLSEKIKEIASASTQNADSSLRDVKIYPSNGKIIIGLRIAKSSDTAPDAGEWVYLSATPKIDSDKQTIELPDLAAVSNEASDFAKALGDADLVDRLRQARIIYREEYQKLIATANERLTRPLKDGYRMEGHLKSASLDKVLLLPDGFAIELRASGDLKILYGL
jgi:hypothetical protein